MYKKIFISIITVILYLIFFATISKSTNIYFKMKINSDNNIVNIGDFVYFNINISDIQNDESVGTNAITAKIIFDGSVLEYISYTLSSGWSIASFDESTMTFAFINNDYIYNPQNIVTLKFKVKSTISSNDTTLYLKDISAAFRMSTEDITKTITIPADDTSFSIHLNKIADKETNTTEEKTLSDKNTIYNISTNENITNTLQNISNTSETTDTSNTENISKNEISISNINISNSASSEITSNSESNKIISTSENQNSVLHSSTTTSNKKLPSTGATGIFLVLLFLIIIGVIISFLKYINNNKKI